MQTPAMKLRQYQADFLRANKCTVDEFEREYIAFMETKPDTRAYRLFARKYQIRIIHHPTLPESIQVMLCVNIAAIKILAKDHIESERAIREITSGLEPKH